MKGNGVPSKWSEESQEFLVGAKVSPLQKPIIDKDILSSTSQSQTVL